MNLPIHRIPDCTGRWWFVSITPPVAQCETCKIRHAAPTLEDVQMYTRENLRGLELEMLAKGLM